MTTLGEGPIAVMDADCALCSWGARLIHRFDRSGRMRIAPVQSETGARLMRKAGEDPGNPDTWLIVEGDRIWRNADAVLHFLVSTGGWRQIFRVGYVVPRPVRDWLYRRVARNRYRLFGRGDLCALPDPAFQARLLK